jgi:toxin CcdB
MAQFDVYRNKNPASRSAFPLLVDLQADLLSDLATRVVAPLTHVAPGKSRLLGTLTPVLVVEGKRYALLTPQLAGIAAKDLGARVTNLSTHRDDIVAALDLLITGI